MIASQLGLLLWKNYLNQRRQPVVTFLEIVLPALFTAVLLVIRQEFTSVDYPNGVTYMPFQPNMVPYWPHVLAYSPEDADTTAIMRRVSQLIHTCNVPGSYLNNTPCEQESIVVKGFQTEAELVSFITSDLEHNSTSSVLGGVVFNSPMSRNTSEVRYNIRLSDTRRNPMATQSSSSTYKPMENEVGWDTTLMYPLIRRPGPREADDSFGGSPGYFYEGFLAIQYGVDAAIIEHVSGKPGVMDDVMVVMYRYPYPPYIDNQFVVVIQTNLPVIIMLGYILAVLNITRNVVLEKEKKLKGFMKIMGLQNWTHWLAHFVWNFGFLFLTNIIICVILTVNFNGKGAVIEETDSSIVFIFLTIYSIAAICYCFAVSAFFTRGNVAAAVAGMLWFGQYMPYFFIQAHYDTMSFADKIGSSFVINTGMALGGQIIGMFEGTGEGVQYDTLGHPAVVDDDYSLGHVMWMMLVDAAICMIIAWYVESVRPGNDAVALPYYFPFTKAYWKSFLPEKMQFGNFLPIGGAKRLTDRDETCFEADPVNLDAVIRIMGISKVFGSGKKKKPAVSDMSLNVYNGQVTALLGHNGAGKTTTMSMITGLMPPTSGTAYVSNFDIRSNISAIQRLLGLCPQHNILFDNLTVEEHLLLFGKLKGGIDVKEESRRMIKSLGMEDKTTALTRTLSGGMKRKLSVGIALIGNSKVVLLDEPTAGMDPSARRSTWDLIQRERFGRTIVLTTHYMEEADLLGDRIAIMTKGNVKCCGSSLFLKNRYGAGYRLIVVFQPGLDQKVEQLTEVITNKVPEARLDTLAGLEAAYILPYQYSDRFQSMFKELEKCQRNLNIASFGVSLTTMEEVFIRVGESEKPRHTVESHKESAKSQIVEDTGKSESGVNNGVSLLCPPRNDGVVLYLQQFYAMILKKIIHTMRNWKILLPQLLVPSMIVLLCLILNKYLPSMSKSGAKPLLVSLKQFEEFGTVNIDFMESTVNDINATTNYNLDLLVHSYLNQFGKTDNVRGVNVSHLFDTSWSQAVQHVPCAFQKDLLGYTTFINQSSEGVAGVFNVHNIVGAVYQKGNVIRHYNQTLYDHLSRSTSGKYNCHIPKDQRSGVNTLLDGKLCEFNSGCFESVSLSAVAAFNNAPYHSPAISLDGLMNGLLRYVSGEDRKITTVNHPLPETSRDEVASARSMQVQTWDLAFTFSLAAAFLSASFLIFLVKERITKAKHLQTVCGVNPFNYWLSALIWDWINIMVPLMLVFILLFVFKVPAFTQYNRPWLTLILFSEYSVVALLYTYSFSYFFEHPTVGFVKLCIYNLLLGPGILMIVGVLEIPQLGLMVARDVIYWIALVISPHFCVAQAMRDFGDNHLSASICQPIVGQPFYCDKFPSSPCCGVCQNADAMTSDSGGLCLPYTADNDFFRWRYPGAGRHFVFMLIQSVLLAIFIIVKEFGLLTRLLYLIETKPGSYKYRGVQDDSDAAEVATVERTPVVPMTGYASASTATVNTTSATSTALDSSGHDRHVQMELPERELDDDVLAEQAVVNGTSATELGKKGALVMEQLRKVYGSLNAVNGLSICIERGECFGFLGVNGAGKTTTFSMITGDQSITSGNAFVNGYNIRKHLKKAQQCMGYCPQFDALIDQMTGYETLRMFGRLRGIPEKYLSDVVEQLVELVDLKQHAWKQVGAYSGGSKRKLSIAVSLVGGPAIVLLDEPTNGLDPVARRNIWLLLSKIRHSGTPIILTSHIMEECEALCTRIAIMVAGQFECLGSPQHLKDKFGSGFVLTLKVEGIKYVHRAIAKIQSSFTAATVKDVHQRLISFHVQDETIAWSEIFGTVERLKRSLHIVDYSVSQTTLEQIFLNFSAGLGNATRHRRISTKF